ncbi:hypothetical protein BSKO_09686 [Bryopsis sp. KO-2023]|nr:hypothetical protein BSKO_09686 [Bryopsis sp. KO-2023]
MSGEPSTNADEELPQAQFIEDVGKYLEGRTADSAIQQLNENYRQFKMEETRLLQRRAYNLGKLPELKKTLGLVKMLTEKAEGDEEKVVVDFELSDSVFGKASFRNVRTVNLWLGAHVMVEYPLDEAKSVLEASLSNCEKNLDSIKTDMEKIKDNITITEVSIARIYNYDVEKRRQEKK